ncbi:hypothetical protein ACFFUB_09005 [Algimonas porphyrae]|uniref:Uncharacterized protein n=1 Tax=Algimonas porphyrae TaxID=1128113 RepID=A0ABQ5V4R6_9PROT|nr:hypothetical protein [Algimonas porphyrae]GLQ21848.1 hypothetical protein GCM10007854_28030 [Algimonas porphyrae]
MSNELYTGAAGAFVILSGKEAIDSANGLLAKIGLSGYEGTLLDTGMDVQNNFNSIVAAANRRKLDDSELKTIVQDGETRDNLYNNDQNANDDTDEGSHGSEDGGSWWGINKDTITGTRCNGRINW